MKKSKKKKQQWKKGLRQEIHEIELELGGLLDGHEEAIKTQSFRAIALGMKFIILKRKNHRLKRLWKDYLAQTWPFISQRSIQRWMLIARHADIDKYPTLGYIPVYRLEELIQVIKKKLSSQMKIGGALLKYDVDPREVKDNHKSIAKFKVAVDELISTLHDTGWTEVENSDYVTEPESPHQVKAAKKLIQKKRRQAKKVLKKQGKVEKDELERSINRSISSLKRGLRTILHRTDKIVGVHESTLKISTGGLEELAELIPMVLKKAADDTSPIKDSDIPDDNDI